jgi:multidrug efflux pump subunit AcrB
MSLSLIAVFIPILLMGGILGRLFQEFAVVLSGCYLHLHGCLLTTTPMMCAALLRQDDHLKKSPKQPMNELLKKFDLLQQKAIDNSFDQTVYRFRSWFLRSRMAILRFWKPEKWYRLLWLGV